MSADTVILVANITVVCHRLSGNSVHLCDNKRRRDACGVARMRRGCHRVVHLRLLARGPRAAPHPRRRRSQRPRLEVGRLLRQHRLRFPLQQGIRRHRRTRQNPPRKNEPTQQRSRQSGKPHSSIHHHHLSNHYSSSVINIH